MKQPPRSLCSLPPKGGVNSFGTAVRSKMKQPPRSLCSLPPTGGVSSFGTAVRS